MVFGTDFPYTNDFRAYETVQSIKDYGGFTKEDREKVFFKNAATLFAKLQGRD